MIEIYRHNSDIVCFLRVVNGIGQSSDATKLVADRPLGKKAQIMGLFKKAFICLRGSTDAKTAPVKTIELLPSAVLNTLFYTAFFLYALITAQIRLYNS